MLKGIHSAGYENIFMIKNLGTIYVIIFISLLILMFLPCCKLLGRHNKYAKKTFKYFYYMFFWNGFMVFLLEGYFELVINAMLTLSLVSKDPGNFACLFNYHMDTSQRISVILSIVFMTILILMPFVIITFLSLKSKKILKLMKTDEKLYKRHLEKVGGTHEGLDLRKKSSFVYQGLFAIRRLLYGFVLVYLEHISSI